MNKRQEKRLLNVARALRDADRTKAYFDMRSFVGVGSEGFCGTPSCALGHYASRTDLQKFVRIQKQRVKNPVRQEEILLDAYVVFVKNDHRFDASTPTDIAYQNHFGIGPFEAEDLFEFNGCGGATTPLAAAKYIEKFVSRKKKEGQT